VASCLWRSMCIFRSVYSSGQHSKRAKSNRSIWGPLLEQVNLRSLPRAAAYDIANVGDQPSDLAGGYAERTFLVPNPFYRILDYSDRSSVLALQSGSIIFVRWTIIRLSLSCWILLAGRRIGIGIRRMATR
jgi:hypothetical protein